MHVKEAHGRSIEQLVADFATHLDRGLSKEQAAERLARLGPNELREKPRPGFWALLRDQFDNYLVIILIAAAVISIALGEYVDSIAIMFIVLLNAIVGVVQESKAEQALAALKKMSAPNAQVLRDGQQRSVPSRELVPGDVVLLEAGNFVPADLRLVESVNLKIEEASLTGESVPVEKNAGVVLEGDIPLGDRRNSAFMGTLITYGRGRGLVASTGMNTQIGLIAEMIQSFEDEDTPLQRKLADLGKMLGTVCLAICAVVFVYGVFRDTHIADIMTMGLVGYLQAERKDIINLFMTAVSLAIAAVPEGLPAIVTICLALGMQRMIKHHALIRKLPAVETLGCATVVCSDKTGTLTQNAMTVVREWVAGEPSLLYQGAALCNDCVVEADGRVIGDPTEAALAVAAAKAGYRRQELEKSMPRVQEIPFDSDRKRMTTIHRREGGGHIAFVKGAPDLVLELCPALGDEDRKAILAQNREMASGALRVLAVAYRPLDQVPAQVTPATVEKDLVFAGLLGMIDPPRPEVVDALRIARGAGLKTVMVTGDYKDTAEAIARDIGLLSPQGLVVTGPELQRMDDSELEGKVERIDVCCRVSPQHKTRVVDALKSRGHIVAMTGDGVNDAPALKRANIGVAMGITGTDVAKQTADMVLTDDNFASIVAAIEQGRIIYSNIRKFVYFLLACNVGEILIVFGAMLAGMPIPLRPVQLLWLNLVSDGAPALALGLEKGDPDTMKSPPRSPREHVINREMAIGIGVIGVVDMVAILTLFHLALQRHPDSLAAAQTMAFVALCTSELLRAFTARSERLSVFAIGVFSNRWMVWAVGISLLLVLMVVYVPFLQPFFHVVPLGFDDWLLIFPFLFASPIAMELLKAHFRSKAKAVRRREAAAATIPQPRPAGGPMKVLVPVHPSHNCEIAVRQVIRQFMNNTAMEIHLINVQRPFDRAVQGYVGKKALHEYHDEQSDKEMAPFRQMLDKLGIPYAVHRAVGDRAHCITDAAHKLQCDLIIMGTARKSSLTRWVENSLTNKVIELTDVPVEVIAGDKVSGWERYGIPAGLIALLAAIFAVAD